MAVEDHPDWPRWSVAFDRMSDIKSELEQIPRSAKGAELKRRQELEALLRLALAELNAAGAAIDTGPTDDAPKPDDASFNEGQQE